MKNIKQKIYGKLSTKYPKSFVIYRHYKNKNINIHNKNKIRSWMFLTQLMNAERKHKDRYRVGFPKGTINP